MLCHQLVENRMGFAHALCGALGLDPLGVIASGALLVAAAPEDAAAVEAALAEEGVPCARLGHCTPAASGRVLVRAGSEQRLPRFDADEVTRVL